MLRQLAGRSSPHRMFRNGLPLLLGGLGLFALDAFAPGCSSAPSVAGAGQDGNASSATPSPSAATLSLSHVEWRRRMAKTPTPKHGCFEATHPSTTWVEVPCGTAPAVPYAPANGHGADDVGNTVDYSAQATGPVTWAEGSFPVVTNVTGETDNGISDNYSLQLNTNTFGGAPLCAGAAIAANCQGWQQFVYAQTTVFIQYWLINYNTTCPAGWNQYLPGGGAIDCWRNGVNAASVPKQPITNLANLTLTATAGTSDAATMTTGDGKLYTVSEGTVHNLNQHWTTAEFNVFGNADSTKALFNGGATIVVQTLTNSSPASRSAPSCAQSGTTGETNNLTLVPSSCCAWGGASPGIQFVESDDPNAKAPACPTLTASPSVLQIPAGYGATTNITLVNNLAGQTNNAALWPNSCTATGTGGVTGTVTPATGIPGQNVTFNVPWNAQPGTSFVGTVSCDDGLSVNVPITVTSPALSASPSSVDVVQGSCATENVGFNWTPAGLGYCGLVQYHPGALPPGVTATVASNGQMGICADSTAALQSFTLPITSNGCVGGPYTTGVQVNILAKPPCVPSTCNPGSCQGTIPDGCGGTLYCPSSCSGPLVCTPPQGDSGHGTTCCGPDQYLPYDGSPCVCLNGGTWDPTAQKCIAPTPPPSPPITCPKGKVYCDATGTCTTVRACNLAGGGSGGCTPAQAKAGTCT